MVQDEIREDADTTLTSEMNWHEQSKQRMGPAKSPEPIGDTKLHRR